MIINIITPFPDMFKVIINESIMLKSQQKGFVKYNILNLFDFLSNPKDRIDDYPFGGGEGMILKPEPIYNAIKSIEFTSRHAFILITLLPFPPPPPHKI